MANIYENMLNRRKAEREGNEQDYGGLSNTDLRMLELKSGIESSDNTGMFEGLSDATFGKEKPIHGVAGVLNSMIEGAASEERKQKLGKIKGIVQQYENIAASARLKANRAQAYKALEVEATPDLQTYLSKYSSMSNEDRKNFAQTYFVNRLNDISRRFGEPEITDFSIDGTEPYKLYITRRDGTTRPINLLTDTPMGIKMRRDVLDAQIQRKAEELELRKLAQKDAQISSAERRATAIENRTEMMYQDMARKREDSIDRHQKAIKPMHEEIESNTIAMHDIEELEKIIAKPSVQKILGSLPVSFFTLPDDNWREIIYRRLGGLSQDEKTDIARLHKKVNSLALNLIKAGGQRSVYFDALAKGALPAVNMTAEAFSRELQDMKWKTQHKIDFAKRYLDKYSRDTDIGIHVPEQAIKFVTNSGKKISIPATHHKEIEEAKKAGYSIVE